MQVFLPERSFSESASVLDQKRLVKQLLEGRQIMTIHVVVTIEFPAGNALEEFCVTHATRLWDY